MGSLIEDCVCKRTFCHNFIDEKTKNPTKNFKKQINEENDSDYSDEENENEIVHSRTHIETSIKDIVEFKLSTNSLVKSHSTNPWDFYFDEEDLGSGSYGTVKKVSLI